MSASGSAAALLILTINETTCSILSSFKVSFKVFSKNFACALGAAFCALHPAGPGVCMARCGRLQPATNAARCAVDSAPRRPCRVSDLCAAPPNLLVACDDVFAFTESGVSGSFGLLRFYNATPGSVANPQSVLSLNMVSLAFVQKQAASSRSASGPQQLISAAAGGQQLVCGDMSAEQRA